VRSLLPRPVRVVAAVVLVGVFLTGTVALVLDRTAERQAVPPAPVETEDVVYPGETPGCDGIPDVPECPPYELAEEPTLEGAIERFRNGDLHIYDVVHLMYTEEDYMKALEPYLGPAVLESSYDTPLDGPWGRSMEGIDPSDSYSRVQQWVLTGDSLLLEMVFVLPSTDDVATLLENHRKLLAENGVAPLTGAGLGDGVDAPVAYRFVDGGASLPARRCVNRVMHAVGRLVFAVTLATGGDCTNPPVDLPVRIVLGAAQRAEAVLGENPDLP
jgi:hypothetical protein